MDELELALWEAWEKVVVRLRGDPGELAKRLSRREKVYRGPPPRAWCLAVRAGDTRLLKVARHEGIETEEENARPWMHRAHRVTITGAVLRELCARVRIESGETLSEVCAKLGVGRGVLRWARVAGVFEHRYHGAQSGWRRPWPLLVGREELDPCGFLFRGADAMWSWTGRFLSAKVPKEFEQTVMRVPAYFTRNSRYEADWSGREDSEASGEKHPHPDPLPEYRAREKGGRRSRKLPPVPPDYVWYKWKGEEYVGYDWRNPAAKAGYERQQRRWMLERERARRRRRERPRPAASSGSLRFVGWRLVCPGCGRKVCRLFFAVARPRILTVPDELVPSGWVDPAKPCRGPRGDRSSGTSTSRGGSSASTLRPCGQPLVRGRGEGEEGDASVAPTGVRGKGETACAGRQSSFGVVAGSRLACDRCHGIKHLSGANRTAAWNGLITYLSGGLLFGHEVPQLSEIVPTRKRAGRPWTNRAMSARTPQVEALLLAGRRPKQIAGELGLSYRTVVSHVDRIYKRGGVHSQEELLAKHNRPAPQRKRDQVRERVSAGESVAEIARELGMTAQAVRNHMHRLRREGSDGRAIEMIGVCGEEVDAGMESARVHPR